MALVGRDDRELELAVLNEVYCSWFSVQGVVKVGMQSKKANQLKLGGSQSWQF